MGAHEREAPIVHQPNMTMEEIIAYVTSRLPADYHFTLTMYMLDLKQKFQRARIRRNIFEIIR